MKMMHTKLTVDLRIAHAIETQGDYNAGRIALGRTVMFTCAQDLSGMVAGWIVGIEVSDGAIKIQISAKHFHDHVIRWIRIHPSRPHEDTPQSGPFRTSAPDQPESNAAIYLTTLDGTGSCYYLGQLIVATD